jgi:hypothetical protein
MKRNGVEMPELGRERRWELGRAAAAARWAKNRACPEASREARRAQKAAPGVGESTAVRRGVADRLEVSGLLDVLTWREKIIIFERFGLDGGKPKTLEEIGKKIGVTRERIRQLQNIALSKLRRARENKHSEMHIYDVRPSKDKCSVDLISDALPFGRLWYGEPNAVSNAISNARFFSRSHDAVIRVYDEAGNVIETHEHTGDFQEP